MYAELGRFAESEMLYREAVENERNMLGPEHPRKLSQSTVRLSSLIRNSHASIPAALIFGSSSTRSIRPWPT